MRLRFFLPLFGAILCASFPAHADTVTTFTLTHSTDVFQFSITDATPVTHYTHQFPGSNEEFLYREPLTINGVSPLTSTGDVFEGVENKQAPNTGAEFFLEWDPDGVFGSAQEISYFEHGPQIYTNVNGHAVFTPGTFTFVDVDIVEGSQDTQVYSADKLVVTQTDATNAAVPEPSSLFLVGTGAAGFVQLLRRRLP